MRDGWRNWPSPSSVDDGQGSEGGGVEDIGEGARAKGVEESQAYCRRYCREGGRVKE